jgi:hypothetical protein
LQVERCTLKATASLQRFPATALRSSNVPTCNSTLPHIGSCIVVTSPSSHTSFHSPSIKQRATGFLFLTFNVQRANLQQLYFDGNRP